MTLIILAQHPQCQHKTSHMESALAQEKLASDDEGDDQTQPAATSTSHLMASSVKDNSGNLPVQKDGEEVSDQMDDDFPGSLSSSESSEDDEESDAVEITHEEVCCTTDFSTPKLMPVMSKLADSLPKKIVAKSSHSSKLRLKSKSKKQKTQKEPTAPSKKAQVKEMEADSGDLPHAWSSQVCALYSVVDTLHSYIHGQQAGKTQNPIHLFYMPSDVNAHNETGNDGDKHFKCCLGEGRILTITAHMKYNTNGKP